MGINTYGNAAKATNYERSLQNGTPKFVSSGTARACYAMLSSTGGGVAFYDKYFQQVVADKSIGTATGLAANGNYQNSPTGDVQHNSGLFYGTAGSSSQTGSSTASNRLNSTNSSGEFGNTQIDCYSNSTAVPFTARSISGTSEKHNLNRLFINSDHPNKAIVYLLNGAKISAVSRINGNSSYDYANTTPFTPAGISTGMSGSASYNYINKEFVILSYISPGVYTLRTYFGIDFDKYPSPAAAFTAPGVTTVDRSVTFPTWSVSNNEAYYNIKPTLCDDGSVFATVMFTSSSFSAYKITRTNDRLISSTLLILTKSITTTYGLDLDGTYGQRQIQSRDGGAVMSFCAYYYYGSGLRTYIIDKRKSTIVASTQFDSSDTSAGCLPVPYGEEGFSVYYAGNVYASTPTGGYLTGRFTRDGSGNLVVSGTSIYLPYFPLQNTTNYPGFTQMTDYSMLNNQATI